MQNWNEEYADAFMISDEARELIEAIVEDSFKKIKKSTYKGIKKEHKEMIVNSCGEDMLQRIEALFDSISNYRENPDKIHEKYLFLQGNKCMLSKDFLASIMVELTNNESYSLSDGSDYLYEEDEDYDDDDYEEEDDEEDEISVATSQFVEAIVYETFQEMNLSIQDGKDGTPVMKYPGITEERKMMLQDCGENLPKQIDDFFAAIVKFFSNPDSINEKHFFLQGSKCMLSHMFLDDIMNDLKAKNAVKIKEDRVVKIENERRRKIDDQVSKALFLRGAGLLILALIIGLNPWFVFDSLEAKRFLLLIASVFCAVLFFVVAAGPLKSFKDSTFTSSVLFLYIGGLFILAYLCGFLLTLIATIILGIIVYTILNNKFIL